jgi:hypothetical protein
VLDEMRVERAGVRPARAEAAALAGRDPGPLHSGTGLVTVVLVAGALMWTRAPRYRRQVRGVVLAFVVLILVAGAVPSHVPHIGGLISE